MPYSSFSFERIEEELGLGIKNTAALFGHVRARAPSRSFVPRLLEENVPMACAINTEKARSELIIAPVLMEVWRMTQKQISLFSGVEFNVDPEQDLKGVCDFLVSLSEEQFFIHAPLLAVVEAKREDMNAGIPQCIAEMRAAQLFNAQKKNPLKITYGAVTTGSNWKFLKLVDRTVTIDRDEYHIKEVSKIVGIILSMCEGTFQ